MDEPSPDAAARKRQLAREAQRRYREKNPGKVRERQRQYREANREKIREAGREYGRRFRDEKRDDPAWQAQRREYARAYREANRPKIRELNRRQYERDREARIEKQREYVKANPAKRRDYYLANREVFAERSRMRRHGMSADQWALMWSSQDGCCYLCQQPMEPDDAVVEHWHGCALHGNQESCSRCQRGLAHNICNVVIGLAGDDPVALRVMADNLEAASVRMQERQRTAPERITLF